MADDVEAVDTQPVREDVTPLGTAEVEVAPAKAGPKPDGPNPECPPGFHWDAKKGCVPDAAPPTIKHDCPPGWHWDSKIGNCVPGTGGGTKGDGGGGSTGGGSSSTGSTSSSGGGGSAGGTAGGGAGDKKQTVVDPQDQPLVDAGIRLYYSLWGQIPPQNYVEKLVKRGMNIFEIEEHERKKPAFKKTKTYQDEAAGLLGDLARALGFY